MHISSFRYIGKFFTYHLSKELSIVNLSLLPKHYLRANLSSQMAAHKKILKNRTVLIEEIKSGIPVNMDGFLIGKELWESFEHASPLKIESDFTGPVKIVSLIEKNKKGKDFSKLAEKYKNGSGMAIEKEFIWTDWKYYIPKPPIFFEAVRSELIS